MAFSSKAMLLFIFQLIGIQSLLTMPAQIINYLGLLPGFLLIGFLAILLVYTLLLLEQCWSLAQKLTPIQCEEGYIFLSLAFSFFLYSIFLCFSYIFANLAGLAFGRCTKIWLMLYVDLALFGQGVSCLLWTKLNLQTVFLASNCYWILLLIAIVILLFSFIDYSEKGLK